MAGLTSAIPAAISGLLAQLHAVAAGGDKPAVLVVVDGDMGTLIPACYVEIGAAVDWVQAPAGLGNLRRGEQFVLDCVLQWHDGGAGAEVAAAVRQATFDVLERIVGQVTADPTLGGAVRFAQVVGGPAMEQGTTSAGGWTVLVPFHVHCEIQLER